MPNRFKLLALIVILGTVFLGQFLIIKTVNAFNYQIGETISTTNSLPDDFYTAAGNLNIKNPVNGDLNALGGKVKIDDTIAGDLFLIAGQAEINGNIQDDARIAGGQIVINGNIGDDLIVRAGKVIINKTAIIGGDVIIRGGIVEINGVVKGNVSARGAKLHLNGEVDGDLNLRGTTINLRGDVKGNTNVAAIRDISIDQSAVFGGNIVYWQPLDKNNFKDSSHVGTIQFDPRLRFRVQDLTTLGPITSQTYLVSRFQLIALLASILILFLIILFTHHPFKEALKSLNQSWPTNFFYGLLYFIITPLMALLLLISLIGIPLGIVLIGFYLGSLYLAKILVSLIITRWGAERYHKNWTKLQFFLASALILTIFTVSNWFLPILSSVITSILACVIFGTLSKIYLHKLKNSFI
ncbi:MAG: hypothetical protein UT55_C0009G0011 [Candidatus Peregrinibacteria bacterium GW2011_GWE2_39_6]|nr:MAG: hypothetical protein UT36_C0014G0011 [Candidatus Peregrinibacteria bacterium GW2011_GWF2_39_17]KKR26379.1 MAG: hypothetical protein UT55_C0009G0011 [Candidatus Peregrinibacteria bacterium GW2011_GWE2_39_6]HCW32527.1 hypothetical protein [Candidatus Peregrinibacteria bacterium]